MPRWLAADRVATCQVAGDSALGHSQRRRLAIATCPVVCWQQRSVLSERCLLSQWMKDLEELGRLKDLGLLTEDEFETARQEILSQRPTFIGPANDDDSDLEDPERSTDEAEVINPSDPGSSETSASRSASETNASTDKNSPNRKTLLAAALLVGLVIAGIVAVLPRSETTLPTAMEPVRTAVLSSTFGPWEDAQSAFVASSPGAKKWEALTTQYRSYFERSEVSAKREVGVSLQGDWHVIEYCSANSCEESTTALGGTRRTNFFEIHLQMGEGDQITDLRWFRGPKDSLEETTFYEVQLDPAYLFDDPLNAAEVRNKNPRPGLDFDYATQDRDEGCLIGRAITPPGLGLQKRWWIYLNSDVFVRTLDGLEMDSASAWPGKLEVSQPGADDLIFCIDYEISEVSELVVPDGDWNLEEWDGSYYSYVGDFVVPFSLIEL